MHLVSSIPIIRRSLIKDICLSYRNCLSHALKTNTSALINIHSDLVTNNEVFQEDPITVDSHMCSLAYATDDNHMVVHPDHYGS